MNVRLRVELDDGGPVVVKSGRGPAADRLRHEHERLARAVHPGVVALAGRSTTGGDRAGALAEAVGDAGGDGGDPGVHELRTCYAGEPVARWAGTVAGIAGLGAAVATTLDDLHALGIVHGRIDASHILIGDDRRPRLCGLSHPGDAAPADDVAALGGVIGDLLARARPDRRGGRRSSRAARSGLRALLEVVERATDPVATRRPSARVLADAILAAVPGAVLPTPSQPAEPRDDWAIDLASRVAVGPSGPEGGAPDERAAEHDTLERIWSHADHESEDERWRQAFGPGPPDLSPAYPAGDDDGIDGSSEEWRGDEAQTDDRARHPVLPPARIATPAWSATQPPSSAPDPGVWNPAHERPDDRTATRIRARHGAGFDDGIGHDPSLGFDDGRPGVNGRRTGPVDGIGRGIADDGRGSHRAGGDGAGPAYHDGAAVDGPVAPPPVPFDVAAHWVPGGDDLTRDHRVPAGRRSSSRPASDREPAGARRRRLVVVAVTLVLGGLAVGGTMALWPTGAAEHGRPEATGGAATAPDCSAASPPAADVDGDGCPETLVVDGTTVDAGVARWSLGQPGDLVTLGDWDCDGAASAALLRPSTGDVFVFGAWAPPDEPVTVRSTQRVAGGVAIRAEAAAGGCDRLLIDLSSGGSAMVDVAG